MTNATQEQRVHAFEDLVLNQLPKYMRVSRAWDGYNAHYDPQAIFCGARSLAAYDFVGRLSHNYSVVSEQVQRMFRDVAQVPSNSPILDYLRVVFPPSHPVGHTSTDSKGFHNFFNNPAVSNIVMQEYKADYERFDFAPPGKAK